MADESAAGPAVAEERHRQVRRGNMLFRAPHPALSLALILVASAALAELVWGPNLSLFLEGFLVFAISALVGTGLTTLLAGALGGRLEYHRSVFLALSVMVIQLPLALVWRGAWQIWPSTVPSLALLATFLVGPAFWFRHLSIYGVSKPSHLRMLPASLLPPLLYLAGVFIIQPPALGVVASAGAFLVLAFVCALALLHASDRPIRREFQMSGVSLIRPLLDHVGERDPGATRALEAFFLKGAIPADLKVSLLAFYRGDKIHATVALPTVHPGPFAALGSSDLPRKLSEQLGPAAGTVLVPHTPSDHDLDLPSEGEVERVATASRELLASLPPPRRSQASPLVRPYPGSLARAQLLGDVAVLVVSQAPLPTDDIAYSVADRILREVALDGGPAVALIDAHNSYVEGLGDVIYGTPTAEKLLADAKAAVRAAVDAARDGPIEVGVAVRGGYSIGHDGIGPQGIRALAVRAAGSTSGYVLIDGNNLLMGRRDPIVKSLESVVDVAEVMTTDNHVVHEVDGGINPVGERIPAEALVRDAKATLATAVANLAPVQVRYGTKDVPAVKVLGPNLTARLLTSLGDTLSMFTNMLPATLLLLLTSSLVVTFALR